jgi:hypothetical protein
VEYRKVPVYDMTQSITAGTHSQTQTDKPADIGFGTLTRYYSDEKYAAHKRKIKPTVVLKGLDHKLRSVYGIWARKHIC